MTEEPRVEIVSVGIDVGSSTTKVVLSGSNALGCEIVRNEIGGHSTPTAISFASTPNQPRQIGATANLRGKETLTHLNRLVADEINDGNDDPFQPFYSFDFGNDGRVTNLDYYFNVDNNDNNNEKASFSSSALLAMLLGKIRSNVEATVQRLLLASSTKDPRIEYRYVLSVGPETTPKAHSQWLYAAYAAGMEHTRVVETSSAYASCYQQKFPEFVQPSDNDKVEEEAKSPTTKAILVVDMGQSQTTVAVVQGGGGEGNSSKVDGDDKNVKEETTSSVSQPVILSSSRHKSLGAGSMDIQLWKHFCSTLKILPNDTPKSSRRSKRLLEGCQKLKELLSQLPQATVTVDFEEKDWKLSATRAQLLELCHDQAEGLEELISSTLQRASDKAAAGSSGCTIRLSAIEVTGGGCRIPWVKDTILSAVSGWNPEEEPASTPSLSHTLDDTSAALGAALLGHDQSDKTREIFVGFETFNDNDEEERISLRQAEERMAASDRDLQIRADAINQMEAHVLDLRSAKHGKHASTLAAVSNDLDEHLNAVEDWIFSPDTDAASKDDVLAKWEETQAKTAELAKEYFGALQREKETKEAELQALQAQAAAEEKEDGDENNDDHDTRRLPKKRRMEIVMKNKAEANELFSDGNFKFAAARYVKALSHCAKFVDLSPQDTTEVNDVKLSLNLNLALAYIKLQNHQEQALRACNEALAINEEHPKALYRRASVYYEQKKWDLARKDVKKALQVAPDDKALLKIQDKIDAQIKRQKLKEKKMAKKMFG